MNMGGLPFSEEKGGKVDGEGGKRGKGEWEERKEGICDQVGKNN